VLRLKNFPITLRDIGDIGRAIFREGEPACSRPELQLGDPIVSTRVRAEVEPPDVEPDDAAAVLALGTKDEGVLTQLLSERGIDRGPRSQIAV
jgi:hypothetical protein